MTVKVWNELYYGGEHEKRGQLNVIFIYVCNTEKLQIELKFQILLWVLKRLMKIFSNSLLFVQIVCRCDICGRKHCIVHTVHHNQLVCVQKNGNCRKPTGKFAHCAQASCSFHMWPSLISFFSYSGFLCEAVRLLGTQRPVTNQVAWNTHGLCLKI